LLVSLSLMNNGRWLYDLHVIIGILKWPRLLQLSHRVLNVISSKSSNPINALSTWLNSRRFFRQVVTCLLSLFCHIRLLLVIQMLKFFDCFIDIVVLTQ
jgi:hypothetical protein